MRTPSTYEPATLLAFARDLLVSAGLPHDRACDVAEVLLEADLLGHTTHGLLLLALYLRELQEGRMPAMGEPILVSEHESGASWDGQYLPGPWLVRRAIDAAQSKLQGRATATITISRSHHIACLQAYLKPVTDDGLVILLFCTDPAHHWVAPHGAVEGVFSPNPLAAGIPTAGEPILIDMSMSTTAAGQCIRAEKTDTRLPGPWLVDENGQPTNDPRALVREQKGALYPLGGADLGYKGFGLALLLEALTSGLAGHGRSSGDARWGGSVFLQLIDPARFGGAESFLRETSFLADACRCAKVAPGQPPVRLPGERALAQRAWQLANGVRLHDDILSALEPWAREFKIPIPKPRN